MSELALAWSNVILILAVVFSFAALLSWKDPRAASADLGERHSRSGRDERNLVSLAAERWRPGTRLR